MLGGSAKQYADTYNQPLCLTFARYWAEQCEKMMAFEAAHQGQCFRIYYEQYAKEPERYLPPLFEFLCEEWEPEVLNFNKKQHDFGLQDDNILQDRGFKPSTGNYRKWDADEISAAKEVIGKTMMKLGYEI